MLCRQAFEADPAAAVVAHLDLGRQVVEGGRQPLADAVGGAWPRLGDEGGGAELLGVAHGHPRPDALLGSLLGAGQNPFPRAPETDDQRLTDELLVMRQLEVGDQPTAVRTTHGFTPSWNTSASGLSGKTSAPSG